jgi:hypothetical protein
MKFQTKTLALTAVLAMSAVPAFAVPSSSGASHGQGHHVTGVTGTTGTTGTTGPTGVGRGEAYGRACANESRTHLAGHPGTPFSQCVVAMAKLEAGTKTSPAKACKTLSKKHVAGVHGTPFSKCVSAAAKLRGK